MVVYEATVLTSRADGISPSLVLKCGSSKSRTNGEYIFNLPESLDRLAADQKLLIKKIDAVFLPEVSTCAMGGLGSRLFRHSGDGSSISLVSPHGVENWLNSIRLLSRKLSNVRVDHYETKPDGKVFCYEDMFIQVAAIHNHDKEVILPSWLGPHCDSNKPIKIDGAGIDQDPKESYIGDKQNSHPVENPEVISIGSSTTCEEGNMSDAESSPVEQNPVSQPTTDDKHTSTTERLPSKGQAGSCGQNDQGDVLDWLQESLMRYIVLRNRKAKRKRPGFRTNVRNKVPRVGEPEGSTNDADQKSVPKESEGTPQPSELKPVMGSDGTIQKQDTSPGVPTNSLPNRDAGGVKHYEQINLLSDSEDEPNCCGERTPRVDRGSQYDATNSTPIEIHTKQMQDAGNAQLRINQGTAHLAGCSTRNSDGSSQQKPLGEDKSQLNDERDSGHVVAYIMKMVASDRMIGAIFAKSSNCLQVLQQHPVMSVVEQQKDRVDAIIHLSSSHLLESESYRDWIGRLPGRQIIVLDDHGSKDGLDIGLRHVLDRGVRLNLVAPTHFPLPFSLKERSKDIEHMLPPNSVIAWVMTSIVSNYRPRRVFVRTSTQGAVNVDLFRKELIRNSTKLKQEVEALRNVGLLDWDNFANFYSTMWLGQNRVISPEEAHTTFRRVSACAAAGYARFTLARGVPLFLPKMLKEGSKTGVFFLGTGCSEPSAWRNGSAILLRVEENSMSMMIDVGEGTYGQLIRYFGKEEAQKLVDSLGCIWVSHQHGDHCLGLSRLIQARSQHLPPILVIAPPKVLQHLHFAQTAFSLNAILLDTKWQADNPHVLDFQNKIGFTLFASIGVEHSCEAYGLVIWHLSGWKLVFSGDTRPSENLRRAGKDCTLLIHEATHAPEELKEAVGRKHSTWKEALDEGDKMGAYRTILTHFSRRYPNLPPGLTPEVLGHSGFIAFDGMNIPLCTLPFLPSYNAAIQAVLQEIEEGGGTDEASDYSTETVK